MLGVLIHQGLSKVERQCCLAVSVARKEASFVIDILSLSSALAFCQLLIVYTCLFSIHRGFYKFLSAGCHSTSFPLVIVTPSVGGRTCSIAGEWWQTPPFMSVVLLLFSLRQLLVKVTFLVLLCHAFSPLLFFSGEKKTFFFPKG